MDADKKRNFPLKKIKNVQFPGAKEKWDLHGNELENLSVFKICFGTHQDMHVGMMKKPLVPYSPTAFRSRLPVSDCPVRYRNSSSFELGDRSIKSTFRTNNQALFTSGNILKGVTNTGIIAEKTRWFKQRASL